MAVATGTQIRPELSAVNYAPFLQAASQSAQMQAQGIAALGAGVTKGFESFVQQQKENKQLEAEVKSAERLGNSLQFFLKDINPEAQAEFGKLMGGISDPNLSLRERAANSKNLGAALNSIIGLAQQGKKVQDEKAAAEYAGILRMGGGQIPSPISSAALSGFTDQQKLIGEELYLRGAKTKADIEETRAKTLSLGARGQSVEERRFLAQTQQQEKDARIINRARQIAFGEESVPLPNKEEELAAKAEGSKIAEAGRTVASESRVDPVTGETITERVQRDITGKEIGREPVYRPEATPEEKRRGVILTEQAKADVDWVNEYRKQANAANTRIAQNTQLIDMFSKGDVKTGPGSSFIQAANRVFVSFGGKPEDIKNVANYGLAVNLLSNQLLDYFSKTKGAISDYETGLFRQFAAGENKTPAENIAILKMMVEIDKRNQTAIREMRAQNITDPAKQRQFLEDYAINNPLDFSGVESLTTNTPESAIFNKADEIIRKSAKPTTR